MLLVAFALLEIFSAIENTIHAQPGPQQLIVSLNNGQVKGSVMQSEEGRDFLAFRGIPYGEPPTKSRRFKEPVAKSKWEGIWDASHEGQACIQFSIQQQKYMGEEDCLLLNVYTPINRNADQPLPVIFYLHGGAFIMGSGRSNEVGPEKVMDYDVVVVVVNYRVGPFGFLSSGDEVSPGNYALLDQVLALKWTQDNIRAFGGDPNRVVLAGTSAGSWAVMLHMVSPLSKGLFNGAIAQSGCPFSSWGNAFDATENVKVLGHLLKCKGSNQEIIDCLRQQSAVEIAEKNIQLDDFTELVAKVRYHAVSDSVRGEGAFLPDYPPRLLNSGRTVNNVPLFIGITSDDGAFIYDSASYKYNSTGSDHLRNVLPKMLQKMTGLNEEEIEKLLEGVIKEYLADDPKDELEISRRLSRIYSDVAFEYCTDKTVEKMSSFGLPVYAYRFTYSKGPFDFLGFNLTYAYKRPEHVDHGEDFTYVFNPHVMPQHPEWSQFDDKDKHVSKILLQLWINFAKNQVPTANAMNFPWTPFTPSEPIYLNITTELSMVKGQFSRHTPFWMKSIDHLTVK